VQDFVSKNKCWVKARNKMLSSGVNRKKVGKQEYQKGLQELLQNYQNCYLKNPHMPSSEHNPVARLISVTVMWQFTAVNFFRQGLDFSFDLNGYMSMHSNRHWSMESPHLTCRISLHDV
jgi:hypothetical protein